MICSDLLEGSELDSYVPKAFSCYDTDMRQIDYILKKFKEGLTKVYNDKLRLSVCYVSQARGEAEPESDIDLIMILDGEIRPS